MYKISKKYKIVISIIIVILIFFISYYIYSKDEDSKIILQENNIIEENSKENSQNDNSNIIVHISGSVVNEGIVELKVNSRVSDAIQKAGGLKEDANISKINLAYILEDGMKIYIPSKNDKEELNETVTNSEYKSDETNRYVIKSSETNSKDNSNKVSNSNSSKVNINNATQTELETLPGIGPSTALKILTYRKENGKFNSIDDIQNVSGIGENKFNKIKELICVK